MAWHTFLTGVHENTKTIKVAIYALVTRPISIQLAQTIDVLSCCVPSKMCLICSKILSLAAYMARQ